MEDRSEKRRKESREDEGTKERKAQQEERRCTVSSPKACKYIGLPTHVSL